MLVLLRLLEPGDVMRGVAKGLKLIASSTTREHDLNEATIPTGITFKWKFGERRPRFPQASQTKRGSRSDA